MYLVRGITVIWSLWQNKPLLGEGAHVLITLLVFIVIMTG